MGLDLIVSIPDLCTLTYFDYQYLIVSIPDLCTLTYFDYQYLIVSIPDLCTLTYFDYQYLIVSIPDLCTLTYSFLCNTGTRLKLFIVQNKAIPCLGPYIYVYLTVVYCTVCPVGGRLAKWFDHM